ncbi:helix-turn-helix transcriptional regulator [Rhodococcus zopfii]|uniref:Helix-turn-helix transcriptional regulator n=1 Tax=Rhodococcus zopfii TaxID=43772 RepID=A0ABU3WSX9_9NOCA|nr:helix-turn-helix transcriptional regulator [Rhodococcus zopfii]
MQVADTTRTTELGRRLVDLLDRKNAIDAIRTAEIGTIAADIARGVQSLDDAASSSELMRRACERIAELCPATRVVLSHVTGHRIVPVISYSTEFGSAPSLPAPFDVAPGSAEAHALATNGVTSRVTEPNELRKILGSNGFAIAPVAVDGEVAMLVHVDTPLDGPRGHALGVFTEVLGGCLERVGLESRREHQDLLVRQTARRWGSDIDFDTATSPDAAHTEHLDTAQHLLDPLTDRETEVVRLVLTGASNAAIAAELVITVDTVKSHVKRILRKLGVTNRSELIAKYRPTS